MKPAHLERLTETEYFRRERVSDSKHELINGQLVARARASFNHVLIATNVTGTLGQQVALRPCRVFNSDLRVNVAATRFITYPDGIVISGQTELHPEDSGTVRNPTILIEVLSEGTEGYDRGAKFAHYRKLVSLKSYLLISQDERRVERFERVPGESWLLTEFRDNDVVPLPAIEAELSLVEVYSKVEFVAPSAAGSGRAP